MRPRYSAAGYISLFSRFWRICKLWRKRGVLWGTRNLISTADDDGWGMGRGVVTKEESPCLLWNTVYPASNKQSSRLSYFANAFASKGSILEEFEVLKHLKHLYSPPLMGDTIISLPSLSCLFHNPALLYSYNLGWRINIQRNYWVLHLYRYIYLGQWCNSSMNVRHRALSIKFVQRGAKWPISSS